MASTARMPQFKQELDWCHALLGAIGAVQQQLRTGSRHNDSINCILAQSMELTDSTAGMLANIVGNEPCRLTDALPADWPRHETLEEFDRLARIAVQNKAAVFPAGSDAAALPLSIGNVVYGVVVLAGAPMKWKAELVDSMAPFTGTAAAVLRQFQEDLSASQVDAVFEHLADGILMADVDGRILSMNAAAEQMFGYSIDEVLGQSVRMLLPEPYASRHDENLEHYRQTGEIRIMGYGRELDGRCKDGSVFPMDVSVSQIEIQGGDVFVVIARDITQHKAQQELVEQERANSQTLEQLVRIDAVTGIANRRHFDESLTNEVRRAAREQKPVSLLLCDIDFFKAFNDRYGHPAGDKALRSVAVEIAACFQRAGELAARYGGEEFGIVVPGTDLAKAGELAGKMQRRIAELSIPHSASHVADHITLSIGVASAVPGPHYDHNNLVEEADRALYRAKGAGRNRIELAATPGSTRQA